MTLSILFGLLKGIMEFNFQVLSWNVCFFYFYQCAAVTASYPNEVTKIKPTFGFGRIFVGGIQTSSTERATIGKLNFTFFKTWGAVKNLRTNQNVLSNCFVILDRSGWSMVYLASMVYMFKEL